MNFATLNNGVEVPVLGLGTYNIGRSDDEVYNAIRSALDLGYRHIDTAAMYGNEAPIGKAIRESGIGREEIFVTTKLWGTDVLKGNARGAFEQSMHKLDIGYIDLYLVHWPVRGNHVSVWFDMQKIFLSGAAKAIGLSNYLKHHLEDLMKEASVVPAVNQVELHPYLIQQELIDYCAENGIRPEAWSPLGSSKTRLLDEPVLVELAEKHNKSVAQIILRWNLERGVIAIPKSSSPERQTENIAVFDFRLSQPDIEKINSLDKNHRTGIHPDKIEF